MAWSVFLIVCVHLYNYVITGVCGERLLLRDDCRLQDVHTARVLNASSAMGCASEMLKNNYNSSSFNERKLSFLAQTKVNVLSITFVCIYFTARLTKFDQFWH